MGKTTPKHRKRQRHHPLLHGGIAVVAVLVCALTVTALLNYWHLLLIDSNSMRPTWSAGAAVLVIQKNTADVHPGNIIAVVPPRPFPQITYVHRVVSIRASSNGHYIARTKGDNNPTVDPWVDALPSHAQVVLASVPYVGYIIGDMTSPVWMIGIIVILVASLMKRVPIHRRKKAYL